MIKCKTLMIALVVLLLSTVACSPVSEQNEEDILEYAEKFVVSVVENKDTEKYATGTVLYNLSTRRSEQIYKVVGIESAVEVGNERWALVNVIVETENCDTQDINYYKLYMVNDSFWKVYQVEEVSPVFWGKYRDELPDTDLFVVFDTFMKELSCGNYDKAGNHLTGRAKMAHYQAIDLLGSVNLLDSYSDLQLDVLYAEDSLVVTNATYNAKDKDMSIVVSFQLTGKGWKVYDISQI